MIRVFLNNIELKNKIEFQYNPHDGFPIFNTDGKMHGISNCRIQYPKDGDQLAVFDDYNEEISVFYFYPKKGWVLSDENKFLWKPDSKNIINKFTIKDKSNEDWWQFE